MLPTTIIKYGIIIKGIIASIILKSDREINLLDISQTEYKSDRPSKIKTTDINILLNRVKMTQKLELKKRTIKRLDEVNKKLSLLLKEDTKNSETWFHGSNYDFDGFSLKNFGKTDEGWWGIGVYFHTDIDTAKAYGKNIHEVVLNYKKPLILPTSYSGRFLYKTLNSLGLNLPSEYDDFSAMQIIQGIGKKEFTEFVRKHFDIMIIQYAQGTKESVVFDTKIIESV